MRYLVVPLFQLSLLGSLCAATITRIESQPPMPLEMDLIEVSVFLDRSYADPFNPDIVSVQAEAIIERPDGVTTKLRSDGFWYQECKAQVVDGREVVTYVGEPHFRVRFRAVVQGEWNIIISARDFDGLDSSNLKTTVTKNDTPPAGFVRVSEEGALTRDGQRYVPFGANVGWVHAGGTHEFEYYFDKLAANGLNWTRVWMTHFDKTALEWKAGDDDGAYTGIGGYNLKAAWRLDKILELAERRGIALQLVLHQHSQFETLQWSSWENNPWNIINGGPFSKSADFFSDKDAIAHIDRNLRYIVARYAHSPAILAFELMNEVDLVTGLTNEVASEWMRGRASVIKQLDPYHHLVTTSYAMPGLQGVEQDWADDAYDIVQLHSYLEAYWEVIQLAASHLVGFRKPIIFGEFGIDSQGVTMWQDTLGIHLVNASLLSTMVGFAGGAMSWWWDSWIDTYGLWEVIGKVAKVVRAMNGQFVGQKMEGLPDGITGFVAQEHNSAIYWLHNDLSEWFNVEQPPEIEVMLTISNSSKVQCIDPWIGDELSSCVIVHNIDNTSVKVSFVRDVLVITEWCSTCSFSEPENEVMVENALVEEPESEVMADEALVEPETRSSGGCSARF